MNKLILILFATIALFSCSSSNKSSITAKFPVSESIQFDKVLKFDRLIGGIDCYNDSLLIFRNDKTNSASQHFYFYNIHSKKIQDGFLNVGRKVGASMGFISYGIRDSMYWAYDLMKDKFMMANFKDPAGMQTFEVPKFFYNVQYIGNKCLLVSGDYTSDFRIMKLNLVTQKIEDTLFKYPPNFKKADKTQHESFIFVDSLAEKAMLAERFSDQMEFFDLKNKTSIKRSGPENYEVNMSTVRNGLTMESQRNKKTRLGFLKGKVKGNYIYLLYSGQKHNQKTSYFGKVIYVFDWDGNPIKQLVLDQYILDFDFSKDGTILYAIGSTKKQILYTTLNK